MLEDVEEMERNGERGKADNRPIDLPRIRVPTFSPEEPGDAEDAEELNDLAENESETTSSQNSSQIPSFLRPIIRPM